LSAKQSYLETSFWEIAEEAGWQSRNPLILSWRKIAITPTTLAIYQLHRLEIPVLWLLRHAQVCVIAVSRK
jgi:hypothetical protein